MNGMGDRLKNIASEFRTDIAMRLEGTNPIALVELALNRFLEESILFWGRAK